jgi:hypothetical protein
MSTRERHGVTLSYVPDYEITPVRLLDYTYTNFYPFGLDNLFPQATALFSRSSPNHRGIIKSKVTYMVGGGFKIEDPKLTYLLEKCNYEGENLNDIFKKICRDDNTGGNSYLEIITDPKRSFLWFNHIDYTKIRRIKDKKAVYIHPDWTYYKGKLDPKMKEIAMYPEWTIGTNEYGINVYRSIYQIAEYEPEFVYYGIPGWIGGKDSILIDLKTNKWNLSRLKNAFHTSGFLIVPVKDKGEANEVLDYIESQHIGEGNQAKLMVITKGRANEGEKADQTQFLETKQQDEGSWINLHNMGVTDIVVAHSWFRSLSGLADNTGFDTKRILNEYEIARKTVIHEKQELYLSIIKKIFAEQMNYDAELQFINNPPVEDYSWKRIWEIRENKGLDFDKNDPEQNKIVIPSEYNVGSIKLNVGN